MAPRGRKPIREHAMTPAERQARYWAKREAGKPSVRYRRPADRRRRPKPWRDACVTLLEILDSYQDWRDSIPAGLIGSPTTQKPDDVLALRGLIEELNAAELPRSFGRD
jgi:hypothetical protein